MSTMMEYQSKMGMFGANTSNSLVKLSDERNSEIIDLASGFSAYHNNGFLLTTPDMSEADQARALTMSKTMAQETSGLSYSLNATTLFEIYYNNHAVIRDFDFREQLYKDFKDNLGYTTLQTLFEAQAKNNFLTPSHVAYLEETAHLLSGFTDRRRVNNESWSTLIYHERGDYTKSRASLDIVVRADINKILQIPYWDLIPLWISTVPGIHDLIWFNNLVWGRPLPGRIQ